jgi:imidazolonepropionase-like amidohydrolase
MGQAIHSSAPMKWRPDDVSRPSNVSAARTIDARERIIAPGFIDVHTYIEGGVEKNPRSDVTRHFHVRTP